MVRFGNILFFADDSPWVKPALQQILTAAQAWQARLTVCGVVERMTQEVRAVDRIILPTEIQRAAQRERFDELGMLIDQVTRTRSGVDRKVLVGGPSHEVVQAVIENGYDLLVKSAQGHADPTPLLFGTVDLQLLRRCPSPVLVLKPSPERRRRAVLAAVAPEPEAEEGEDLNARILGTAAAIAALEGAEMHVLHVWKARGEGLLRGGHRLGLSRSETEQWLEKSRQSYEQWLTELMAANPMPGQAPERHLEKGDASHVISDLAARIDADLVVMGTHRHTGIRGLFMGSTAEQVLGQVECSVMAVKPKGFARVAREQLSPRG